MSMAVEMEPLFYTNTNTKLKPDTQTISNDGIKLEKLRVSKDGMRKMLLGLGYWMQGFRCFTLMAILFYVKDVLRVAPSMLQVLINSANIPLVAKPFYGVLSDSLYFFGQHRVPYIAGGALLQVISCFAIASSPTSTLTFLTITILYFFGNLGAGIVEVTNDAVVAECTKQGAYLQSFAWVAAAAGGISGNLVGGFCVSRFSPQAMFLFYAILLSFQFVITVSTSEKLLDLPKNQSQHGIRSQIAELFLVLRKPEIHRPVIWFAASFAVIPSLTGPMFYYQTKHLNVESSVIGASKMFGQITMLLWGVVYNRYLKSIPPRTLISSIQRTMALLMVSDALFVSGFYRALGVPDSLYVVVVSGILEVLYFYKILPFQVLMAKLYPSGCEGSLVAFVESTFALAFIVSGYFGATLASWVEVTDTNVSGLRKVLVVQAVCTVLPLFWASYIPI